MLGAGRSRHIRGARQRVAAVGLVDPEQKLFRERAHVPLARLRAMGQIVHRHIPHLITKNWAAERPVPQVYRPPSAASARHMEGWRVKGPSRQYPPDRVAFPPVQDAFITISVYGPPATIAARRGLAMGNSSRSCASAAEPTTHGDRDVEAPLPCDAGCGHGARRLGACA